jgi:hypothetical protein
LTAGPGLTSLSGSGGGTRSRDGESSVGAGGGMANWFCSGSGGVAVLGGGPLGGWMNGFGRADGDGAVLRGAAPDGESSDGAYGLNWSSTGGVGLAGR